MTEENIFLYKLSLSFNISEGWFWNQSFKKSWISNRTWQFDSFCLSLYLKKNSLWFLTQYTKVIPALFIPIKCQPSRKFQICYFRLLFYYNLLIFSATVEHDSIFRNQSTYAITRTEKTFSTSNFLEAF